MYSVTCPHCQGTLLDDGSMAGLLVACPSCAGQFHMPAAVAQPLPPVTVAPGSIPSMRPAKRKKKRHWAKTALLIMAISWLPIALCAGAFSGMTERAQYRHVGYDVYRTVDGRATTEDSLAVASAGSFIGGFSCASMVYFCLMFVLGVVWFATKDD